MFCCDVRSVVDRPSMVVAVDVVHHHVDQWDHVAECLSTTGFRTENEIVAIANM